MKNLFTKNRKASIGSSWLRIFFTLIASVCPHPAFAFWTDIFGYGSYEECVLDKMQGTTGDLAAKQIAQACREITADKKETAPVTTIPTKIERVYVDIISSEWVDNPIFGNGTTFRVLVTNNSQHTLKNIVMWAKMESCNINSTLYRLVQQKLNAQGYRLTVDGQFGRSSRTALRKFQKAKNLPETGDLDAATLGILGLSDVPEVFPPYGKGMLIGTYKLDQDQSAYVDFINFFAQSKGREFCFRLGTDVRIPLQ